LDFQIFTAKVDFPPSLGDIPVVAQFQALIHSKDNKTRMHRIPTSKSANQSSELEQGQRKTLHSRWKDQSYQEQFVIEDFIC
jgi:hypothetical protein